MVASDHVLPYFTAFRDPLSPLYQKAFTPTFPNDFVSDIGSGGLPSVSWIIPPLGFDDHPSSSPDNGMYFVSLVLGALTANADVWSKTAFFLMYDENDGWFDHVSPPTAPAGTAGEYLTAAQSAILEPDYASDDLGITGPLGLGVRVPALAISHFSRGGHISSATFDHTSQLKLVGERFGVEVPNVSAWRRRTVGDLTSALFAGKYNTSVPKLPVPALPAQMLTGACSLQNQDTESGGAAPSVPTDQTMPNQQGGTEPAGTYLADATTPTAIAPTAPTAPTPPTNRPASGATRKRPMTVKSSYNRLAAPPI
jgi:phospholipase C